MPNLEINDFVDFPLGVVAHDAGAANHIIAWLKDAECHDVYAFMEGPAAKLWAQSTCARSYFNVDLSQVISQSRVLLTGTGWGSALEHDARKLARAGGLRTIAVVDHWTNYDKRFVRRGELVLPDEIWVTDEYAKKIADYFFSSTIVVQLPNAYLNGLVREVREKEKVRTKHSGCNLLYVLEPIRDSWGNADQQDEFKALDFFVSKLSYLNLGDDLSIRFRRHPSDPVGKYDRWLEMQGNTQMFLDDFSSLAESIAWADVVVGCESYAMVVALAAGRRVVSSNPPWAPRCVLPQEGIVRLADLV